MRQRQNTALWLSFAYWASWPLAAITLTYLVWKLDSSAPQTPVIIVDADDSGAPSDTKQKQKFHLFSENYPVSPDFQKELDDMRTNQSLQPQNEYLISRMVAQTSTHLNMPPGILWCLLFQESRLNHLVGLNKRNGARGIGQFSKFGFLEVNEQLDHYDGSNLEMLKSVLGSDVRPIRALDDKPYHPSSYYYIPTAVAASAAYLNNRYLQIRRSVQKKGLKHDDELLWLYAVMAYNKGTRSVLTFLNQAKKIGGTPYVEELLTRQTALFENFHGSSRFQRALRTIWNDGTAKKYATELTIHMRQISRCAVEPNENPFRTIANQSSPKEARNRHGN